MWEYIRKISEYKETKFIPTIWINEVKKIVLSATIIGTDGSIDIITYFNTEPTEEEKTALDLLATTIQWEIPTSTPMVTPTGEVINFDINDEGIPTIGGQELIVSGSNMQGGEVTFNREKQITVTFAKPFKKKPYIDLTLGEESTIPPYRVNVSKTEMTIKFKVKFIGSVEWKATII